MQLQTLEDYLQASVSDARVLPEVATTIQCIAGAAVQIAALVARGPLAGEQRTPAGVNADGDLQQELDLVAHDTVADALRNAPVAWLVSEEREQPAAMREAAPLVVAVDPLDGSSNIDTNIAVGTIFSILPARRSGGAAVEDALLQPGVQQLAAGYSIYGPRCSLVLTLGDGTHIFTLDPAQCEFRLTMADVRIAETTREFAINVSNFRHWEQPVRSYIDDCLNGADGVRRSNYNMRWVASLVAECHRIFSRGGIFLYPADSRHGYANGRLRLLYECNPIAFLVEQAGGSATTGVQRIMEIAPTGIHQRVPLIFGSGREIRRVENYFAEGDLHGERSQLFGKRGLFRA